MPCWSKRQAKKLTAVKVGYLKYEEWQYTSRTTSHCHHSLFRSSEPLRQLARYGMGYTAVLGLAKETSVSHCHSHYFPPHETQQCLLHPRLSPCTQVQHNSHVPPCTSRLVIVADDAVQLKEEQLKGAYPIQAVCKRFGEANAGWSGSSAVDAHGFTDLLDKVNGSFAITGLPCPDLEALDVHSGLPSYQRGVSVRSAMPRSLGARSPEEHVSTTTWHWSSNCLADTGVDRG
ncbi:hypothetical protein GE09DRAFT_632491 [Coniochaeta sp. 2T2.1]|nr:hypothetical protein GE09DRAFT_632491 [Coniochaeta sp. 2T2.1]